MALFDATLIIAFYNNIETLRLVFAGLSVQTFKNFEVIIADDGSRAEVVEMIKILQKDYEKHFSSQHVWHEDIGWRKNIILNKAILASNSEILIFIDGDCIPHPRFIEEHYSNSENNYALAGRRINMSPSVTKQLTETKIKNKYLQKTGFLKLISDQIFSKTASHVENGIYIKNKIIRRWLKKENRGLLGCNFSIKKADMLKINGFDERYNSAFAGEDTDVQVRLYNNGGRDKSVKHIAIVYHCYHPRRSFESVCMHILNEHIENKTTYTPFGIYKE